MVPPPERRSFAAPTVSRSLLVRIAAAVLLLLVLVFAYQALRTGLALRSAQGQARELKQQLSDGDQAGATRSLREIAQQSATAHSHSDGILWDAVASVPWLGDNVEAVQVISRVLDDTSQAALPSALRLSSALDKQELRSADGRFDLDRISGLAPEFDEMDRASEKATGELDGLDSLSLLSPLREANTTLQEQVGSLRSLARAGSTASHVVPTMLGADGPRSYLLVVQNNAEARATGGLPGSFSILNADGGKLGLGSQRSGGDFAILKQPVLPLTQGELALYGPNLGEDIRDTNLTPDFPRTAGLMKAMLEQRDDQKIDGVISVDPIALRGVLAAVGPITVGADTLTADNVVAKLLNEPYQELDTQDEQNAYFAGAARGIFDALLTKKVNQPAVVRRLAEAGGQRRLLVWSSHEEEQKRIEPTAVGGALPTKADATPQVGLYLNDATAAKMQYYLDYTSSLDSVSCTADGVQTLNATMVLDSSAPKDASGLSEWVTGFGQYTPKGTIRMNLRIYAPVGGSVAAIEANGNRVTFGTVEHEGRDVALVGFVLKPGEQIRLQTTLKSASGQAGDPVLQVTPGVYTRTSGETVPTSCS